MASIRRMDALCLVGFGLLSLASCQSYEARPLNESAHREAWHARTLEGDSLQAFLARIEEDSPDAALGFDAQDGLSLREARLVALVFNPRLRLARLRLGKSANSVEFARLLEDPVFSLDLLHVTDSVSNPWIVNPGLAFSIPLGDRLDAEHDLAAAELAAAEGRALEEEWAIWHELRVAWIDWSAARLRMQETLRFVGGVGAHVQSATHLVNSGELARTEVALFIVEEVSQKGLLQKLRGEVAAGEQSIRALIGLSPEAPLELLASIASATAQDNYAAIGERNPTLSRLRAEYGAAEQGLRRAIEEQVPDLSLGPLVESDSGRVSIGIFGGIPLPMFNANAREIGAARIERELARAAFEVEYESLVGRRSKALALADSLGAYREHLEATLLPLVDTQVEDAADLMRLGEGTSLVLLESLTRAHAARLQFVDTRAQESIARAELEFLIGPTIQSDATEAQESDL